MSRIRIVINNVGVALLLGLTVIVFAQCGRFNQNPTTNCGAGLTYSLSEQRCVPEANFNCNPKCGADFRCVDGTCQPRLPNTNDGGPVLQCAVTCGEGQVCENGVCVRAPCPTPCKAGEVCINGTCSPTSDCIPPCPQTGFVCVVGVCKRLCPSSCPTGTTCNEERGVCEKPCNPACAQGEFCNNGTCVKIEDKDQDGFTSDRDCDDNDKAVNPNAAEVCDGKDNDCDSIVDNIVPRECYNGAQGTLGVGVCSSGRTACEQGKEVCSGAVEPSAEVCDKKDNDCNGQVDDNCK